MENKKRNIIFGIICSLFFSGTVFAAIDWPSFPGTTTISNNSSIAEVVAYAYVVFVSIGTFIAVMVLISAGIDLLLTHNIAKAKPKVLGAILGVILIVSPYVVVKLINPDINKPQTIEWSCDNVPACIIRKLKTTTTPIDKDGKVGETKVEEKEAEEMSPISEASIGKRKITTDAGTIEIEQEITLKKYNGLQCVIGYSEENYKGTPTKLYCDDSENDDLNKPLPSEIVISGNQYKSYQLISKVAGAFFYEKPNYDISTQGPYLVSTSISDFKSTGYEEFGSIDIVNPLKDKNYDYIGLFFEGSDFRMKCQAFYKDMPTIDGEKFDSVKIIKRDKNYLAGSKIKLAVYNNYSCVVQTKKEENNDAQLRKCEIILINNDADIETATQSTSSSSCIEDKSFCSVTMSSMSAIKSPQSIEDICPNLKGEDILSFSIDSSLAAINFLSSGGLCDYWDLSRLGREDGTCNRVNASGSNPEQQFKPVNFFVIPRGQ